MHHSVLSSFVLDHDFCVYSVIWLTFVFALLVGHTCLNLAKIKKTCMKINHINPLVVEHGFSACMHGRTKSDQLTAVLSRLFLEVNALPSTEHQL